MSFEQPAAFDPSAQDLEETLKLGTVQSDHANFLLGYIFLQERDLAQSDNYLMKAYSLDPKHVQNLIALGQLRFQQRDYAKATDVMNAALGAGSRNQSFGALDHRGCRSAAAGF